MLKKGSWYRVAPVAEGEKDSYPLHEVGAGIVVKLLEDAREGTIDVVAVQTKGGKTKGGLMRSVYAFQLREVGAAAAVKYLKAGGLTIQPLDGKGRPLYYYNLGIVGMGRGYREAEIVAPNDEMVHRACNTLLEGGTKVTILNKTRVPARGGKTPAQRAAKPRLSR